MMSNSGNIGKLLPNMKITIDRSSKPRSLEAGEIEDDEWIDETKYLGKLESDDEVGDAPFGDEMSPVTIIQKCGGTMSKTEIIQKWMNTINAPKTYTNKLGSFATGIDLSSEVLIKKLENRAQRFGLEEREQNPVTQLEIDALYKSLGLDPENLKAFGARNIRLGVVHMRGVSEMSTKQVIEYFKDYGPSTVEWINDISCNVCWYDETSAARALLGMSQPITSQSVIKVKNKSPDVAKEKYDKDEAPVCDKDEAPVCDKESLSKEDMAEALDYECDDTPLNNNIEEKSDNEPKQSDLTDAMEVDDEENGGENEVKLDIPIPPGFWRLGIPHPKAKTILLRFATKDDKKLPGAEKRSQYYQKHGNPNYGGLKGLISSSRKRKMQANRTRQMVDKLSGDRKQPSRQDPVHFSDYSKRSKVPRMKMYADEEEEKIKRRKSEHKTKRVSEIRKPVKSRLGGRYTRDDLQQLGRIYSSEEDEPQEILSVTCKIPSRYNIWTDQAMAMAAEDENFSQFTNSRNYAYGSERALKEDEKRYSRYKSERETHGSERRASYQSRGKYGSSNPYSGDLRDTLNSSSHVRNSSKNDLRSRIGKLKEENKKNKHRSPLCIDDSD